jgi:hypothetical protein
MTCDKHSRTYSCGIPRVRASQYFTTPHWTWETGADQAVSDEFTARIRAGENPVLVMLHNDGCSLEVFVQLAFLRREGVVAGGRCTHPDVGELAGSASAQTLVRG